MTRATALLGLVVMLSGAGCNTTAAEPPRHPDTCDRGAAPNATDPSWIGELAMMRLLSEQGYLTEQEGDLRQAARLLEASARHGRALPSMSWFDPALDAAILYAKAGHPDDALRVLDTLVTGGFTAAQSIATSPAFKDLATHPTFENLLVRAQANMRAYRKAHSDPETAPLVFADVPRFWTAFDKATNTASNLEKAALLRRHYLLPGTPGLVDFYWRKMTTSELLARQLEASPGYYAGIRAETLRARALEPQIREGFRNLRTLYPDAHFPPTTFVIGRLNSGGTAGWDGMLIGLDMWSYRDGLALDGVPASLQPLIQRVSLQNLPLIVLHEQVHAMQQYGGEQSLLYHALMEGSADFIAHLALPQQAHFPYYTWGLAHEARVWARFEPEMKDGKYGDWLANYSTELIEDDWHPDLGYFVGARISEAYYAAATDKVQAIHELMFVVDPFAILRASGYAHKFASSTPS